MFCPGCGKILSDVVKFCGACGTPVNNAAAEFVESIENQTAQEVAEQISDLAADTQTPVVVAEQQCEACEEQMPQLAAEQPEQTCKEPQTETPVPDAEKTPEKRGDGVLKGILASVLCVLVFVFMTSCIGLLTARFTIASENVKEIVDDLNYTTVEDLVTELNIVNDYEVKEYKDVLKETFSKSTIPGFIGEKLGEYGDYLLGGSKPEKVVFKDVSRLFEKNRNVADMFFNFDDEDNGSDRNRRYERYYEKSIEPALNEFYDNSNVNKVVNVLRIVLSIWIFIGIAAITAALIAALIKLKVRNGRFLGWLGWTFTVCGGLHLLTYVAALVARLFIGKLGEGTKELIGIVLGSIAVPVVIIGGVILLAGIVMIIIKKLISKKAKQA